MPDYSSLGLSFVHMQQSNGDLTNIVSANWSRSAILNSQVFVTAFADVSNRQNYGIFAGISIPLGDTASVSTGATSSRERHQPHHRCQPPARVRPGRIGAGKVRE